MAIAATSADGGDRAPGTGRRPVILVVGATGVEGGSVAAHLLANGRFAVRALTRDPGSAAARRLARGGAEVVSGDLGDRASLRGALRGCWGVFGTTGIHGQGDRECAHGRNLINAAAGAEIEHLVFRGAPPGAGIPGGTPLSPCAGRKAELAAYAGRLGLPLTVVEVACRYDHLLDALAPRPGSGGGLVLALGVGGMPLAAVAPEDAGGVVAALFDRPGEFVGRTVAAVGDDLPCAAYARAIARALGRPVACAPGPPAPGAGAASAPPEPAAGPAAHDPFFASGRRGLLERSRALYPAIRTFAAWLAGRPDAVPAHLLRQGEAGEDRPGPGAGRRPV